MACMPDTCSLEYAFREKVLLLSVYIVTHQALLLLVCYSACMHVLSSHP